MSESAIPAAIAELQRKYEEEAENRRKADERMANYSAAIAILVGLETPTQPVKFEGTLADACRAVLKTTMKPMSPTDVRDGVVALGFDLSQKNNEMASIHSVLKRLEESGNVERLVRNPKDGTATNLYMWTGRADAARAIDHVSNISSIGRFAHLFPADFGNHTAQLLDLLKDSGLAGTTTISQELANYKSATDEALESARATEKALKAMDVFGTIDLGVQNQLDEISKNSALLNPLGGDRTGKKK